MSEREKEREVLWQCRVVGIRDAGDNLFMEVTLSPRIQRLKRVEEAARRVVMAQEQMGHGAWLPSQQEMDEADAAWADLREALGLTPDPEAA